MSILALVQATPAAKAGITDTYESQVAQKEMQRDLDGQAAAATPSATPIP